MIYFDYFISIFLKFFFLLTPFFAITVFLVMTADMTITQRRFTALKTTGAMIVICLVLYYFGNMIFRIFGITLDSFRIGAGSILFITSIGLVRGSSNKAALEGESDSDISVVPMAIPFIVGPGTIGALLVMGAETVKDWQHIIGSSALVLAIAVTGLLLYIAGFIEKMIGKQGLNVMSKISGLILASLAAQIVFTGIRNFLNL
jgi:multiple antibiotic resistance protein